MIIIIDGYNVLKQQHQKEYIEERERMAFLSMLGRYSKKKKHKIIVVFDGGQSMWPNREAVHGVTVIYSGMKDSADTVIHDYMHDHHNKDILLVSSDNELAVFAQEYRIPSIGSRDFYAILKERMASHKESLGHVTVAIDDTIEDLDELMEAASKEVPVKQEDLVAAERAQSRRSSKSDRVLLKKLDKL